MNGEVAGLILAGGSGTRLGLGPKGFLNLGGTSLIKRVINTLNTCVSKIRVGVPVKYLEQVRKECPSLVEVYPGGDSRQSTVYSLFQHCDEPLILIHDVSRPFASRRLVREVIEKARSCGAAAAFINTPIPIGYHQDGFITSAIPRTQVLLPQVPQAFHSDILKQAYDYAFKHNIVDQTTWQLVLRLGVKIKVVEGEERNIKITTPFDWEIARKVIAPEMNNTD